MRNKAYRRFQEQRMYNHVKYLLKNIWHRYDDIYSRDHWTEKDVHVDIKSKRDNITTCSCWGCRNERHNEWLNTKERITMQERRELEKFNEEIKEVYK